MNYNQCNHHDHGFTAHYENPTENTSSFEPHEPFTCFQLPSISTDLILIASPAAFRYIPSAISHSPSSIMTEGKERYCHPNSDRAYITTLEKEIQMLLYRPSHVGQARKSLDAGLLRATFNHLVSEDEPQKYMIAVLGALAMQVGAEIDARHLHVMKSIYQTVGLRGNGIETVKWGLDRYGNHGQPVPWHASGELFWPDEPDVDIQ